MSGLRVRAQALAMTYRPGASASVHAVRDLSFEAAAGERIAIVGPSGAGKSTLLHLAGLMERPTAGTLFFDEQDTNSYSDDERARARRDRIGFVFQLHHLLPDFTVMENLLVPRWESRVVNEARARDLLARLGIASRAGHVPGELSGGEQQRAALARALMAAPGLILADEPTGNLDQETGAAVEDLLFSECAASGITLLLVTHDPVLARRADRILEIRDGVLVSKA
jgi:lipoprotein-releasing system ATP-binding protein